MPLNTFNSSSRTAIMFEETDNKFWILKERGTAVRRVISKCIKCRKLNAKPEQQIMAPLPVARITPAGRWGTPPFTSVAASIILAAKVLYLSS